MSRKFADWVAIEHLYRAGQLSNAEIGHLHGVTKQAVQKQAKKHGWTKDLSAKVALVARAKLSRGHSVVDEVVDGCSRKEQDDRTIEEAAARVVEVVRGHRKLIAKVNALSARLMAQLERLLSEVEQDTPEMAKAENRKQHSLDLDKASKTVAAMAAAIAKTIPLERQAFNVDGARTDTCEEFDLPPSIRARLEEVYGRN